MRGARPVLMRLNPIGQRNGKPWSYRRFSRFRINAVSQKHPRPGTHSWRGIQPLPILLGLRLSEGEAFGVARHASLPWTSRRLTPLHFSPVHMITLSYLLAK